MIALIAPRAAAPQRDWNDGIIVDSFAGGGGASTGIELALRRHVDVAVNHDPEAVAMHAANHPATRHFASLSGRSIRSKRSASPTTMAKSARAPCGSPGSRPVMAQALVRPNAANDGEKRSVAA